jgi:Ca-activated chloride channel family protein
MVVLLEALIVSLLTVGLARAQFASGVNLVEVYATVTDRQGKPIAGLTAADFQVAEDGVPQAIAAFAADEFPLSVAVAIDRSFSMTTRKVNRLAFLKAAARTFIGALRPDDQVMLLAIGSEVEVAAPLSPNHAAALEALGRLDAWGTTPLYDATLAAIDLVQPAKGRRALVLLSDGADRYSRTSAADLLDRVRRHDVLVYPVAVATVRPPVFAELADASGARSFVAGEPRALDAAMSSIARELRAQYLLGYAPRNPGAGAGWRAIDVSVDRTGARVRARDGYYAR